MQVFVDTDTGTEGYDFMFPDAGKFGILELTLERRETYQGKETFYCTSSIPVYFGSEGNPTYWDYSVKRKNLYLDPELTEQVPNRLLNKMESRGYI